MNYFKSKHFLKILIHYCRNQAFIKERVKVIIKIPHDENNKSNGYVQNGKDYNTSKLKNRSTFGSRTDALFHKVSSVI